MDSLDGRVALITGASRGIGAATARMLDAAGVKLGLVSRSGDDLGIPGAVGVAADVRDADAIAAAVDTVVDRHGGLDILFVNAGVGAYGPILDLPAEHLDEMIEVNVKGAIHTVRAALPHLLKSDAADIVTLASEAGRRGLPNEAVYCASKFAQVGLTARARPRAAGAAASAAPTSAPVASPPTSRWVADGRPTCPRWPA